MSHRRPDQIKLAPAYGLAEAARYLGAPASTLGVWFRGQKKKGQKSPPILHSDSGPGEPISFIDLVEAHLLLTIRKGYGIPMARVRSAAEFLAQIGGNLTSLAHRDFFHDHENLFLKIDEMLISLSERGQSVNHEIIAQGLTQIDYGSDGFAEHFFPVIQGHTQREFAVSPSINFGQLYVVRIGVAAEAIASRFFAGEERAEIALDYGATAQEVDEAIRWHGRIAA